MALSGEPIWYLLLVIVFDFIVNFAKLSCKMIVVIVRLGQVDPWLNDGHQRVCDELASTQRKLRELQEDFAAAQYSSESFVGRQLIAKCRRLQQENEDLGALLADGDAHKTNNQLVPCN